VTERRATTASPRPTWRRKVSRANPSGEPGGSLWDRLVRRPHTLRREHDRRPALGRARSGRGPPIPAQTALGNQVAKQCPDDPFRQARSPTSVEGRLKTRARAPRLPQPHRTRTAPPDQPEVEQLTSSLAHRHTRPGASSRTRRRPPPCQKPTEIPPSQSGANRTRAQWVRSLHGRVTFPHADGPMRPVLRRAVRRARARPYNLGSIGP
jgi:hypothetical protein